MAKQPLHLDRSRFERHRRWGAKIQKAGAFPDVERALWVYWETEEDRARDLSLQASWLRLFDIKDKPRADGKGPAFGAAEKLYYDGKEYDRMLAEIWGDLWPTLKAETREGVTEEAIFKRIRSRENKPSPKPKKRGRPRLYIPGREPWKELQISRATYYRKKRAGLI